MTRIQSQPKSGEAKVSSTGAKGESTVEYSAREVSPQELLLQHLLRAHSIFLLHHGPSLADLYARVTRPKFCAALDRFWNRFIWDWDVLLHGTPAVDVFNGLKLAAGGELGIGVGEEEWGSGEREVLEGFIGRTAGLVDAIVSRFGDAGKPANKKVNEPSEDRWLGTGKVPSASDGVIFSGVGAVTRSSLRAVSAWMEWMYKHGQVAYGVQDNPHAPRRRKRRKARQERSVLAKEKELLGNQSQSVDATNHDRMGKPSGGGSSAEVPGGIPPPIISAANRSLEAAALKAHQHASRNTSPARSEHAAKGTDTLMKYMTFGLYGSGWGQTTPRAEQSSQKTDRGRGESEEYKSRGVDKEQLREIQPNPIRGDEGSSNDVNFLIGLQDDLESEDDSDEGGGASDGAESRASGTEGKSWNSRMLLRTLHVERKRQQEEKADEGI